MSSQGLPTLELDVRARRAEAIVAVVITILATILAIAAAWQLTSFALALSLTTAVVVPVGFRHAGWIGGRRQIVRIVWQADGRWFLTDAFGRTSEGVLRADARISTRALWLRWDIQFDRPATRAATTHVSILRRVTAWRSTGLRSMLLASADLPEADLRRLFVRLRLDRSRPATQLPTMQSMPTS